MFWLLVLPCFNRLGKSYYDFYNKWPKISTHKFLSKSVRDSWGPSLSVINSIRSRGLVHRMFQEFLHENQTEYGDLIYHTEVWWLSRGNVIQRFVALRSEIWEFLQNDRKEKPELGNKDWLWLDIFHRYNRPFEPL